MTLFGKSNVMPASEDVIVTPISFSITDKNDCVFSFICAHYGYFLENYFLIVKINSNANIPRVSLKMKNIIITSVVVLLLH